MTPGANDKEATISQRTAAALADLYASLFGHTYNSRFVQSRAENTELAAFLFKLDFSEETRQRALSRVSPSQVREFILMIFNADRSPLAQGDISWILCQGILTEVKSLFPQANESYQEKVRTLLRALNDDGYVLYKEVLLTKQELLNEFGVWFNPQSGKLIDMRDSNQSSENHVPSAQEFLISVPLYKPYELDSDAYGRLLYNLGREHLTVDSFCVGCGLPSTFKRTTPYFHHMDPTSSESYLEVTLSCTRTPVHRMKFYIRAQNTTVTKVGQFPSIADLSQREVKKYRKVLADQYSEFTRAIGLAAHGVGVGSLVYFRRIFENLIEKAHQEALKNSEWQRDNEPRFANTRMNEKIRLLKGHLPAFLVENHEMYGILSKSIHDLTEEESLEYFPVMKSGIELILDDEIERLEQKAKQSITQKAIDAIKSRMSNK